MNKKQAFEWYAKYVWPVVRRCVKISRRCRRCILSERYTDLEDGVCEFCRRGETSTESGTTEVSPETRERFDQLIRAHVGGSSPYDALLLLSGGKDSAYILHRIRQEYPDLRLLCVTVNNGFMSPFAIRNANFVAEKLATDLVVANACIGEFADVLREAFLSLNGRGAYGVVDFADGSTIFKVGQRLAKEHRIPLLIGGLSWVQVQMIVGEDDFQRVEGDGPRMVFPLAVWRTDEQEIRRQVRELELMLPGSDSPLVSNSTLIFAMMAVDIMNIGYSSFEPEFAQLVREGKTDRKHWLHLFELFEYATKKGWLHRDLRRELDKLNLTVAEVVTSRIESGAR